SVMDNFEWAHRYSKPGHESAGAVAAVGSGVSGIAFGDHVVAEGFRSCGVCDRCRECRTNLCSAEYAETGFTHPGAFAEYLSIPARLVHRSIRPDLVALKHLRVQGIFAASGAAWSYAVQLFVAGKLDLSELISHRFPLDEFQSAF